ncbi:ABC-type phosphate transport system, periplasmic component [Gloeomargarita lithophora Alchichica-D10]|uniref:ABC-type phosphate transport system, periplasmic component n=1 Tax=Gloeomargarita lithophora Alchichica-D10 TaxID=1188229 RepID=A0A1J0AH06_9CYAN|nr:substrate-binding domain-containing protein [Gloeomargarita lithophora]APB35225.1 ABC-type phosphate transport system, periplasmic component [Gloeomargarita lithophora Alchichica-D10]
MVKAPRRDLVRELVKREQEQVTSRISFWRSQAFYQVYRLVPARFQWLLPGLQEWAQDLFRRQEAEEQEQAAAALSAVEAAGAIVPPADLRVPLIPEMTLIQGNRGRYQVQEFVGMRGQGRLYRGVQVNSRQVITLREYVLPTEQFPTQEIRYRQQLFSQTGGVTLADSRRQNLRLVEPWEAISDQREARCYLVSQGDLDRGMTLAQRLQQGAFSPAQVRQVLHQVLQTLEALHTQKFRLPGGQIRSGLAHGQLGLEHLLWVPVKSGGTPAELRFLVYVTDLGLWEFLFIPSGTERPISHPRRDLVALGYAGLQLLHGAASLHTYLDPKEERHWPVGVPSGLKEVILRLLELGSPFADAAEARRVVGQVHLGNPGEGRAALTADPEAPLPPFRWWRWWPLPLLLLVVGVAWWGWLRLFPAQRSLFTTPNREPLLCCMAEVANVPKGQFKYSGERGGTWAYVLQQVNLVQIGQSLTAEIQRLFPRLDLTFIPADSNQAALNALNQGQVDFAVTPLVDQTTTEGLGRDVAWAVENVAYDGLAVVVVFSYAQRRDSLPRYLNGQITLAQLRQLYTGQITNWQSLGGPNLPVRLYIPTDTEAVALFEQRVLQDEGSIRSFRRLVSLIPISRRAQQVVTITPLTSQELLRQIIQDFEREQVGGIGFSTFSRVFGQCAGYPLAISEPGQPAVQALIQDNGRPIDPTTNLCDKKGGYRLKPATFASGRYPLAYPLSVVYARDNSRPPVGAWFTELLRTTEAQRLLQKAGLVPLQELDVLNPVNLPSP